MLSGDHVYKMDYAKMLRCTSRARRRGDHRAASRCRVDEAHALRHRRRSTSSERVTGFQEKPREPDADSRLARRGARLDGHLRLRGRRARIARSKPTPRARPTHDFGKDILPALIDDAPVYAYRFYDENKKAAKYWRDIGTLDAYYEANMDLCHVNPEFNLYDPEWPMRT